MLAVGAVQASLKSKLIIGFLVVTVPLFALLMYNNFYAMNVVRTQVAQSNDNLLSMYMNEIDRTLENNQSYLYSFVNYNADLNVYHRAEPESAEYYFSKVRLQNKMMTDIINYANTGLLFVYSAADGELLSTPYRVGDQAKLESVGAAIADYIAGQSEAALLDKKWKVILSGAEAGIARLVRTEYGDVVGAWIEIDKLMVPLQYLNLGRNGQAFFTTSDSVPIARTLPDEPGQFLTVSKASAQADIRLEVRIPEEVLLQQLPYFQRLIFVIPFIGACVLAFYLLFLRNTLLKPMNRLIKGMRRIRRGELDTRLTGVGSREFLTINENFNAMASEIHTLKINVYEEQIRTQKAELKHLQAQINPHFLLNAINIVYQLAELKKTELIQKMATHITKYFRFVTRTNLQLVPVRTELEHIESYLEIQQLRFPQYLVFGLDVDEELRDAAIPPLLIQPFVENAIKHGFEIAGAPFEVRVSVRKDAERPEAFCEVRIADNGKGIDPEQLRQWNDGSVEPDFADGQLGIWNVRQRLELIYGHAAELRFGHAVPKGTIAAMRIPLARIGTEGGD